MATKSALEIVVELKMLASVPANRPSMAENVISGLVMFMDHPSSDVVLNGNRIASFLFSFSFSFFFRSFFSKFKNASLVASHTERLTMPVVYH